jgi:hypothetical protein
MGFAPPPRDGFALLAAHTRMRLHAHIITNGRRIRNDFESAGGSFLRFLLYFRTLSAYGERTSHRERGCLVSRDLRSRIGLVLGAWPAGES